MAGIRTKNRHLPPHMKARTYTNRQGQTWTGYYYRHKRDAEGRQKETPLGSDLSVALKKWAEIEGKPAVPDSALGKIYQKYITWAEQKDISGLSAVSIRDYKAHWKMLARVFAEAPIDQIQPSHIIRYFDARESKIRAKKEIKYLSTLYNWAKARGYAQGVNPTTGVTRQMKVQTKRTIYVTDTDFALVRKNAIQPVQDAMDIALLTGQRPADVFKMRWEDIKNGILTVHQNKTGQTVHIAVEGQLKTVLQAIRKRFYISPWIISNRGKKLTDITFRRAFTDARDKAETEAKEAGIRFQRFQFKDLRAKAATDSADHTQAQKLLGHKHATTTDIYRRNDGQAVSPLKKKIS